VSLLSSRSRERPETIFSGSLRITSTGIVILILMIAFEEMAVAPALPTIARDLHGLSGYGWAFTGFLIANIVGMIISGQVSDRFGPRPPLIAGMGAFLAGLVVAGSATTMTQLVAARMVQGLGAGLLITAMYVVIGSVYKQALQPKVFAATASAWVLPALVGPFISGTLTQHVGWRWVFFGLLPFVVLACVLLVPVVRTLERPRHDITLRTIDRWRILRAVAVAVGVAAMENAGQHPSAVSLGLGAGGLALLVWGLRTLLPRGTFRVAPGVSAPIALRGLLTGAFFGLESMVPLSLTVQHGYGAMASGLPLSCAGLTWAAGSWWQGRTVAGDDSGRRVVLLRTGFALIGVGAVIVAVAERPELPAWLIYPAWAIAGLGAGLSMATTSVLMLRQTSDADRGAHSAALQLSDVTCAALTTGLAGVLVAAAARHALGYSTAFTVLDVAMAAVAVLGCLLAGRVAVRAPAPPPSRRRRGPGRAGQRAQAQSAATR
jgi:MFS family permease